MEQIKEFIEFLAEDLAQIGATLFPWAALGLVGLYVLWLVIGYLRVSQVGLAEGVSPQPVHALPPAAEDSGVERPRGVPYCAVDNLQYPAGATFCTVCERDLLIDCVNCGATLAAGEASCYRCGTPTGAAAKPALLA
jgi:hypothetical protein